MPSQNFYLNSKVLFISITMIETTVSLDEIKYPITITNVLELFYVELPKELFEKYHLPESFVIQRLDNVFESTVTSYGIHGLSIFEQVTGFLQDPTGNLL